MPVFPKPAFPYAVDVTAEKQRLTAHRKKRKLPSRTPDTLLLGTWNIANLGAQARDNPHRELLAHVLGWFDAVAIQECRDNIADLYDIVDRMGSRFRVVMSDVAGNNERMVYVYDAKKLILLDEVGEIALPPSELRHITIADVDQEFIGFDRNPYLAAFQLNQSRLSVQLVNVHSFFGSENDAADLERRALEAKAVARWVHLRSKSPYAGAREIVALGDFNMPKPKRAGGTLNYGALTDKGLVLPPHSTEVGSSIASDNQYDQVAMLATTTQEWMVDIGVFDFDDVIFPDLWTGRGEKDFKAYLRYYISDHRPLWVRLAPRE